MGGRLGNGHGVTPRVRLLPRRLPLLALLLALAVATIAPGHVGARSAAAPPAVAARAGEPPRTQALVRIGRELKGVVLAWENGRLLRLAGAHVGTGETAVRTDAQGRFTIPASIRTNRLTVVVPGYRVLRRTTTGDYAAVLLRRLDVRAIYLPYQHMDRQSVLDWVVALARAGTINAIVIDMKDDSGQVHPLFATDLAVQAGAVKDLGTDVDAFLTDLDRLGVYKIARLVTFRDNRFGRVFPEAAILTPAGQVLQDGQGLVWTNPFSDLARRYNVELAGRIAERFEEIQFDYVRFPTEPGVAVRNTTTSGERAAIIALFLQEAAGVIHARGAAIAADTFGQTAMIVHDDGIGQILETLAPPLDYYSPMVYPSTWTTGWFGLPYPPADPYRVVLESVSMAVARLREFNVVVRPWLQDFHDYQARKLFYGATEVRTQIDAAALAGGQGFMLWDPSLDYQIGVLDDLAAGL